MKPKILFFIYASGLFALQSNGQVRTKIYQDGIPARFYQMKTESSTIKFNPPTGFNEIRTRYKNETDITKGTDKKFATELFVNVDLINTKNIVQSNGEFSYISTIVAEQAVNISVEFGVFNLQDGDVLSISTDKEITDSITSSQNNQNSIWATRVYQGNELTFVLKSKSTGTNSRLLIRKINFGYRKFGVDFGNIGGSAPCHTNANCPAGNGWDNEKNSVAMIVADGTEQCTGALVMNTCSNNIPYFLTANHCLGVGNVPNWVFQFQTLSTDCATNTGWVEDIQFNGCQLRANDASTDFALLQLNQTPASNSGIHYSGWSRQGFGNTSVTVLHHPQGDLMKISVDNNAPTFSTFLGADCFRLDLDLGHLEGGSSGAPYYNQDHRIVAQHYGRPEGGSRPVCDITVSMGGRFDLSWTGGGTNATRLSNWLNPTNAVVITTNTTNVSSLNPVDFAHVTLSGDATICGSAKTYSLSGSLSGLSVSWSASNSYITLSGSGSSITATPASGAHGYVTLTATVGAVGCQTNNVKTKLIYVGTPVAGFDIESYPDEEPSCFSEWGIYTFRAVQTSGETVTGWEWGYRITGTPGDVISPYDSPYYTFIPEQTGNYEVFVRPKNSCGSGSESIRYITVYASCPGFRYITTFPNPAKDELIVSISDEQEIKKEKKLKSLQLELVDLMNGLTIKRWMLQPGQKQYRLNVSDVKRGTYVLKAVNDNSIKGRLLIIDK